MTEKAQDPTKKASQEPDEQDKTTEERVAKQDVTEEVSQETVTTKETGDFVTGTATPDKEG